MKEFIEKYDSIIIDEFKKISLPLARIALFVIFFWFGFLKLFYVSPANPLVEVLLQKTMPFISFESFIIFLGIYEMVIGITFLIPHLERVAIPLLGLHMITTFLPLVLVPDVAWQSFLVPTLEGQYIIKNLGVIALATVIAAHLHPLNES